VLQREKQIEDAVKHVKMAREDGQSKGGCC
jgi:hypothetical protein